MPTLMLGYSALIAAFAARCARKTSASPSGVRELTKICGWGVPKAWAFSMAANFAFSIIFSKFMPTCTVPWAFFAPEAAAFAACSAMSRKRLEMAAKCNPMLASLIVQI